MSTTITAIQIYDHETKQGGINMETTLRDIAEAFDASEPLILICLQKEPELIESWTRKEKDTLYFHPKGVDGIERLLSEYEHMRFKFGEIKKGLGITAETLKQMIVQRHIKFDTLRKSSKSYEDYNIRGIELDKIISELSFLDNIPKESEEKAMPTKKTSRKRVSKETIPETTTTETNVEPTETPEAPAEPVESVATEVVDAKTTDNESNNFGSEQEKSERSLDVVDDNKPTSQRKSRKAKVIKPNPIADEMIDEILDDISSNVYDISKVRQFLLDSGEVQIETLATLGDAFAKQIFDSKYTMIAVKGRILIVSRKAFRNLLSNASMYENPTSNA